MERASTTEAVSVGLFMGLVGFLLAAVSQWKFDIDPGVGLLPAFVVGMIVLWLIALGWSQVRSAVCSWGAGVGAFALAFAKGAIVHSTDYWPDWQVNALGFLVAAPVALGVAILVEKVLARAGPGIVFATAWAGRFVLAFGLLFGAAPLLIF